MPQNIRDVMTSNPCTIDADKSVAYAAKMMQQEDVGLAPIVEGDKLVGMLTDRDIATRVTAKGRDPDQVKVRDVASKQLITIDPQQDLSEALRMMAKHQVRRLPVVQEDGRLVGVVAQADVAREADDRVTGRLVEEISESGGQMSSIEEGQFPTQFPRQVEDRPESFMGQEPQQEEMREEEEEEAVSKVQAASSRGRRKRASSARKKSSGGARKTAARKSTGTRRRKTASRKRSTAKRSTAKRSTAKRGTAKRSTAKRRATSRKRSTAKRGTAKRSTAKRRATSRKRSTAKRGTAKRSTAKRRTTSRKRSTAKRSTAKRSTAKRSTAKRRTTARAGGRRRTTRRKTR
jgi:CBS domain-containing protein